MVDVFISYARDDYDLAILVKERIEALGLSVYFDVEGLDGGDVFPDVLDNAVKTARVIVGVWTPHSLTRPWVKTECLIGKDRKCLIPVIVEPVQPLDVPAAFYGLQTIDLTADLHDPGSRGHQTLVRSLSRTLKRPDLMRRPQPAADLRPDPAPRPDPRPAPQPKPPSTPSAETIQVTIGLRETLCALGLLACAFSLPEIRTGDFGFSLYPLSVSFILAAYAGAFTALPRWVVIAISVLLLPGYYGSDVINLVGYCAAALGLVMVFDRMRAPAPELDSGARWKVAAGAAALVLIASVLSVDLDLSGVSDWRLDIVNYLWLGLGVIVLAALRLPLLAALVVLEAPLLIGWIANAAIPGGQAVPGRFYIDAFNLNIGVATILASAITLCIARLAIGEQRLPDRRMELALLAAGWVWLLFGGWFGRLLSDLFVTGASTTTAINGDVVVIRGVDHQPLWLLIPVLAVATGRQLGGRPLLAGAVLGLVAAFATEGLRQAGGGRGDEVFLLPVGQFLAIFGGVWLGHRLARKPSPKPFKATAA